MKIRIVGLLLAISLGACSSPLNVETELNPVDLETPDLLEAELTLSATPAQWTGFKDLVTDVSLATYGEDIATDASSNVFVPVSRNRLNTRTPDYSLVKLDSGGNIVWTVKRGVGAPNFPDRLTVATDPAGNVYLAGNTAITLEGQRVSGQQDAFVTKYNTNGKVVWTRLIGAGADDGATGVGVDSSGEVYVSGWTCGTGLRLGGNVIRGACDMFVTKLSNGGARRWVQLIGTNGNEQAKTMSVSANGTVAVTGNTDGAFPGFGVPAAGTNAAFAAKLSSSGTVAWVKQFDDTNAKDVAIDFAGDVVTYGYQSNAIVRKLQGNNGQLLWSTLLEGVAAYNPGYIEVGPSNKIYVSFIAYFASSTYTGLALFSSGGRQLTSDGNGQHFEASLAFRGNNLFTAGYTQSTSNNCDPTPQYQNNCLRTTAQAAKYDLNLIQQ
jgi:Beta-propeller repeat